MESRTSEPGNAVLDRKFAVAVPEPDKSSTCGMAVSRSKKNRPENSKGAVRTPLSKSPGIASAPVHVASSEDELDRLPTLVSVWSPTVAVPGKSPPLQV